MKLRLISPLAAVVVALALTDPAAAQIRGSEAAVVAQTIDGTTVTVAYSRPRAAGRTLFGELVPFDEPWTGANWATTLESNKHIRLNGAEVPAGKYSVWWVPQPERWTLILDPNAELFHFQKPGPSPDQIRLEAEPREAPHAETLTWTFPAVTGDAATLQMHWGTTAVPLQVIVEPTRPVALDPEIRAGYVGSFEMEIMEGLGWPTAARFEIWEEGNMLRGRLPFPIHPEDELEFDLIPAGQARFSPGLYRNGKLFNVEMGGTFEFDLVGERAETVRLRGIEGSVFATGTRVPPTG